MKHLDLEIGERTLRNGLTLLAVRNPGVETFAAATALDVDVRDEGASWGLANLVGDCLDEGTDKHSSLELSDEVDKIGGSLVGKTTGGGVQCPAENAKAAVRLLAEMVRTPSFPTREVRRVQEEILQEIRSDEDDARVVAALRFRREVYGDHPYGHPVRGTTETLASFGRAQLRRFHTRNFVPAGGYIAAAGPDAPEQTLDMLARAFRGMKGTRTGRPEFPEIRWQEGGSEVHLPLDREQVHVYLGHPGIRRTHPDFYALSVMDHILGTGPGFTSRISRRLRDEQGLCYSVDASITGNARREPGSFTAYIGTSPEHRQRAIDGFLEEMRRIRDEPPTAEELRDVQEYLVGAFVWQFERNANLAAYVVRAKHFELGFDYIHRYPQLIRAITPQEVQRVAREHLDPDRVVVVSAGAG